MIYRMRNLVVGVAELSAPDPVVAAAIELAERTSATLHLVHAFELPDLMWDAYARMGYMDREALGRYAQDIQARLEACVRKYAYDERVRYHIVAAPVAATIHTVALREDADLILIGATRRGSIGRTILGTTAQRVARGAPAPVLVLRRPLPARLERVLLTTDLTSFSAGVHEVALDLAEALYEGSNPDIRSLAVVSYCVELPPPLPRDLLDSVSRAQLTDFLFQRRDRGRPAEGVIRYGDATREILAEAAEWKADLLVMGTHGRQGPSRWLLGSVAEATIRSAQCNVLVIPACVEERRTLPVPVMRDPVPSRIHRDADRAPTSGHEAPVPGGAL